MHTLAGIGQKDQSDPPQISGRAFARHDHCTIDRVGKPRFRAKKDLITKPSRGLAWCCEYCLLHNAGR